MELGATLCLPSAPGCERCPLVRVCRGRQSGDPERFPAPRPLKPPVRLKWVVACCLDSNGRWLLRQVKEGPILRGLWLPPFAELRDADRPTDCARKLVPDLEVRSVRELAELRHSITHRRIRVFPVLLSVDGSPPSVEGSWVDPEENQLPTSSLFGKLIEVSNLRS
jgi:A/G-specific adenine glycosylase